MAIILNKKFIMIAKNVGNRKLELLEDDSPNLNELNAVLYDMFLAIELVINRNMK